MKSKGESMSLWAEYVSTQYGDIFIEKDYGFISYEELPEGLYVKNIYVTPSEQGKGYGRKLMEEVVKLGIDMGKDYLLGSIQMTSPTKTDSLKAHLVGGFEPYTAETGILYLKKELKHG